MFTRVRFVKKAVGGGVGWVTAEGRAGEGAGGVSPPAAGTGGSRPLDIFKNVCTKSSNLKHLFREKIELIEILELENLVDVEAILCYSFAPCIN